MGNHRNRFPARRRFLKQSAALSAGAVAAGTPLLALGQASAEPDAAAKAAPADSASTPTPATQAGAPARSPLQPARPAPAARPPRRRVAG